jgi:transposase InsO family protein
VFGAESSMAGKKSVYENAHAEIELFDYIEVYYNRIRKHSALDYMSPEKFEQIYKQNELLNLQSKLSV